MEISLTRSMPANLLEQAQIAKLAWEADAASAETRVRILHGGDEWSEEAVQTEIERIKATAEERSARHE